MAHLAFDDALPGRPERVLVAGTAGSGKSTLARRIATATGLPHTELDGLYHGPGWVPRPTFRADVERLTVGPRWVSEWQYTAVRPLLAGRADLLVWLDPPVPVVMTQLVRRTLARRLLRRRLWNGNVEPPLPTILTDPDRIVRWGWRTHLTVRDLVAALGETHPHLPVVHLRSHREAGAWLAGPLARALGRT